MGDCNWAAMVGRVYDMTDIEFQAVYNATSFGLATMMATTMYLWFRMSAVKDRYESAVCISGLVTFIAAYHYFRIFNSWVEAYSYSTTSSGPQLTGVPFNDAYRYMDWLLTVPLLLIEILLVMNLSDEQYNEKAKTLGIGSALVGRAGSSPWPSSCTSFRSSSSVSRMPPTRSMTRASGRTFRLRRARL